MDYCRGLQEIIDSTWNITELGSSGIAKALSSGAWLSLPNPFNVPGIYEDARDWIDNLLVTSYINKAMKDNDTGAEHGYEYNLTTLNFEDILSKGSQETLEELKTLVFNTPGPCNLTIYEIPNMAFVTGGDEVQLDASLPQKGSNKGWHLPDPWMCQYASTTTGSGLQMFVDHVPAKVRKSIELPIPEGVYN
ncbi:MAG: hypothetical protein L6R42_006207 [Xanthoria sp. 1 TBL-2021]|nr:MAG: hypothetical protein L6R42_006207 [Xanthoria sp. 1 TBL-2021]